MISGKAAWIIDNYAPGLGYSNSSATRLQSEAATQLAVWSVLYSDFGVTFGSTEAQVKVENMYQAILDDLGGQDNFLTSRQYVVLHSGTTLGNKQDIMVATPIPGAALLLGSGLLMLAGLRKKYPRS